MNAKQCSKKPIIWTISGSDCSGGAGIAADIKTGHALGVEVCHLITANTVQNSAKLAAINAVPVALLQQQVALLLPDKPPSVIKIGLLANAEQVTWLTQTLSLLKQQNTALITVYDPVGQASVGGDFHTLTVAQLTPLLAQIDLITPNLMEAKSLAQLTSTSADILAKKIQQDFDINSVMIKGGHSDDVEQKQCLDYCLHRLNQLQGKQDQPKQHTEDNRQLSISYQLSSARIQTHYNHGGGCSFATAIAAFLAQGYLVRDAFTLAKAFINQGLAATKSLSAAHQHNYYGAFEQTIWPHSLAFFPHILDDINQKTPPLPAFRSLDLNGEKLGLYPVVDSIDWLKRLLPLGLNIIQLRIKNLPQDELAQAICEAVALTKDHHTRLFINDYWQLAIKYGAYGVHIGQEDLINADLAQIQQAGLRLGISSHGCYEFLLAQQLQPSYLAVGAIFPTTTKDMNGQIQGIGNLRSLLALRTATTPVVAIGGINLERAPAVLATGVTSIAVVTAITKAKDPELAVKTFKQLLSQ